MHQRDKSHSKQKPGYETVEGQESRPRQCEDNAQTRDGIISSPRPVCGDRPSAGEARDVRAQGKTGERRRDFSKDIAPIRRRPVARTPPPRRGRSQSLVTYGTPPGRRGAIKQRTRLPHPGHAALYIEKNSAVRVTRRSVVEHASHPIASGLGACAAGQPGGPPGRLLRELAGDYRQPDLVVPCRSSLSRRIRRLVGRFEWRTGLTEER